MGRTDPAKWLAGALVCLFACSGPAKAQPPVGRAEALRAELGARGMIVGRDPELGAARAVADMARRFDGLFDLKRCGLQGVQDTPDKVARDALSTFAVSFRVKGDRACDGFKDGAACEQLRNNCITLGATIFCDYDYLYILRNLARASYAYTHLRLSNPPATIDRVTLLPFSPDVLVEYAAFQAGSKPPVGSPSGGALLPPSMRGAVGYAQKYGSVVGESAEFAVVNAVVGHEMAHVESNTCPIGQGMAESPEGEKRRAAEVGIKVYSKDDAKEIAGKYIDMTCHTTLSQSELTADLRGIGMLGSVLWVQYRLQQAGYADAGDRAAAELWRLKNGAAVIALAQAWEYQLVALSDLKTAAARVRSEPKSMDKREMYAHYRRMGYEHIQSEFASGMPLRAQRHMHLSYRAGLVLSAAGLPGLYEQRRQLGFGIGFPVRLYGYLHGSLEALQVLGCSRDGESAARRARDFLDQITGVRKGEYLVD